MVDATSPETTPRPPRFEALAGEEVLEPIVAGGARRRAGRALLAVMTLVNFLGPLAAGIWMTRRGLRMEAGIGLGLAIVMPLVFSWMAFKPASAISAPATRPGRRAHPVVVILVGFMATLWQLSVIGGWTLGVFTFFGDRMYGDLMIPVAVWAYGTVMGPLSFMASYDHDGAPGLTLSFAFIACIGNAYLAPRHLPLVTSAAGTGALVVAVTLFNTVFLGASSIRQRRLAGPRDDDTTSLLGRDLRCILNQRPADQASR